MKTNRLFLLLLAGLSLAGFAAAQSNPPTPAASGLEASPPPTRAFQKTAGEMANEMVRSSEAELSRPLSFPKGNGLRILMTGHSWVAPGRLTLPIIARAAGYTGHVQRAHSNGGYWGTVHAIWLNEHGQGNVNPKLTILLPAIATGQWDVLTWGAHFTDKPAYYVPWIDLCLKANPAMLFYVQDGWPTEHMGAHGDTPARLIASLRQLYATTMIASMRQIYDYLQTRYPQKVHIIPAGAAVVEMLGYYQAGQLPGFDCLSEAGGKGTKGIYGPDNYHLSRRSGINYLIGYCYFAELYRRSPESIPNFCPPGVDPRSDHLMRVAAWHAVIQHSALTGLTDENHNGIADQFESAGH